MKTLKTISLALILAVFGFVGAARAQTTTGPSVPTGVSASIQQSEQVYVSWNASTDNTGTIDDYYLYRNGAFIETIPGYTYYLDTPGPGSFTYTVAAADTSGSTSAQSSPSTVVNVIGETTAPSEPTGLTATVSSSSVTLSWNASTDGIGVVGYYISRNGVRLNTASTITGTSYTDMGLIPGTTYTYTVAAYNASKYVSNAAVIQATPIYDITPPSVPTNVIAMATSSTEIDLTWASSTDNVEVAGYNIYRNGTEIGTATTNSYADTGLSPQTTYQYRISAYDELNNTSGQSLPPVSATTLAQDTTPPSIPQYFTATALDPTDVMLTWLPSTDNVGVAGYYLYQDESEIATTASTSYEVSGLATGTTYYFSINAYDAAGNVSAPNGKYITMPMFQTATTTVTASTTTVVSPANPIMPTPSSTPVVTVPPVTITATFTTTLYYGLRSTTVTALQNLLISQGDLGPNYATGFFGSLTQAAVRKFQCNENIVCYGSPATTGWGSVGPRTRAALNTLE